MSAQSLRKPLLLALALVALAVAPVAAAPGAHVPVRVGDRTLPVTSVTVLGSAQVDLGAMAREAALAAYRVKPPVRPLPENERDGEPGIQQPDQVGITLEQSFTLPRQLDVASPAPGKSFAGLDDIPMVDSSYIIIPPDVNGAVGPTKIFQNLNNNVRILDKSTGAVLSTVGVNTFWAPTGAAPDDYTDPRSIYDPYNNRFITIMQGDLSASTANSLCLGVSDTSDPQGTWHLYRFSCYENSSYMYADYPTLGFNKNWVTISINMYNSAQTTVRRSVFMVHYPTLRNSNTATVFRADYGTSNVICGAPCVTYSATSDTEYVVQRLGTSTYGLDMITGTGPGAPTYTKGTATTRPGGAWNALGTANYLPQSAPVSGTSVCGSTPCAIERNDDNVRSPAVFRNGAVYFAQAVGLPSSSITHVATQWTQVTTPSGAFVTGGRLQDTLATTSNGRPHYANPSISVNSNGDFILGFTRFSSSQHPGAGYAIHLASDGVGTLRDTVVYHDGEDYYHKTFSTNTGRNRWGDFSTAQVDPSDDLTLWTVQEYAKSRATTDDGLTGSNASKWGTWWAGVTPSSTPQYLITASAGSGGAISPSGNVYVAQGNSQTFTITPNSCYAVTAVTVDGISQGAITTYTFTNVQAAHTISATFALRTYSITASAGAGGSVTPSGTTTVNCGASQAYTIAPNACYHVVDVQVDGVSQGAITSYNFNSVAANHTISATFALTTYTVTASAGANGGISPSGATSVSCGGTQAYTITPGACYHVADVLVDGGSVGAVTSYSFTNVQATHTISASFAITTYAITASAGANGSISPSGTTNVNCGATQAYTITPGTGYAVADVQVDGSSIGSVTSYSFTNVQAPHTIAATFAIDVATFAAGSTATVLCPSNTCVTLPVSIARGGATPLLGYSVTFQLGGGLTLCAGTSSLVEGSFLSAGGTTLYDVVDHGGGSYTVDDVLGATCGVTAKSGTLFTLGVASASAGGTGTVTITSLKLRDCGNNDLPTAAGPVATVPIDNQAPVVTVTAPSGGEALAIGGSTSVTWTATDNIGVAGVDLAYSTDGGATYPNTIATGIANTGSYAWTVPNVTTTTARVRVTAHDTGCTTGSGASAADFSIGVQPVAPIANLAATQLRTGNDASGTTKIQLTWSPAVPAGSTVQVYRAGFGAYPLYSAGGGAVPATPTYPPVAPWTLTAVANSGDTDQPGARDFEYYVAFVTDVHGTHSVASNVTAGTLGYELGDVSNGSTDGQGDNLVNAADVALLAAHYGLTGGAEAPYGYLDVGPTTTHYVDGRPLVDGAINFEDLVLFGINYGGVSSPLAKAQPVTKPAKAASTDMLTILAPQGVTLGQMAVATLSILGPGDLQAVSTKLTYDPAVVTPVSVQTGDLVSSSGGIVLSPQPGTVDVSLLGVGSGLASGDLASVVFQAIATGDSKLDIATIDGRDALNHAVAVTPNKVVLAVENHPTQTALMAASPNPFSRTATLSFSLAKAGPVELAIYTVDGRKVRTLVQGDRAAGVYRPQWDGRDEHGTVLGSGVYFERLTTPGFAATHTIVYLK